MTTLFVAGEGEHELGRWARSPEYRHDEARTDGVLAALFARRDSTARVVDGVAWRRIRKFKAGAHRSAEVRNLLGAALQAKESGADVFVWVRDTDGKRERRAEIEKGMALLDEERVKWAGGPAEPCLEGWILDLAEVVKVPDEQHVKVLQSRATEEGLDSEVAMVRAVEAADLAKVSSPTLKAWLERASSSQPG